MKVLLIGLLLPNLAYGFETTDTLPSGVRNVTIKSLQTNLGEKVNRAGDIQGLAEPLSQDLTLEKVLKSEKDPFKAKELKALMLVKGLEESDSLGQFQADLAGRIQVVAPIFSYGLSDRLTLAIAVPYYQASIKPNIGFKSKNGSDELAAALHDPLVNRTESAQELALKVNDADGELDDKLTDNGFDRLEEWQNSGIGDITLAAKYKYLDQTFIKASVTTGIILPTGREDDPDNLIDIPYGDGTADLFVALAFDEPIFGGLFANQFLKYTYNAPGKKEVRLATADESIEVAKDRLTWKPGDKIEMQSSIQYAGEEGLQTGVGLAMARRLGDDFKVGDIEVERKLEEEKDSIGFHAEYKLGYSSVPAFRREEVKVPYTITAAYKQQLTSARLPTRNVAVNDFVSLDIALFF